MRAYTEIRPARPKSVLVADQPGGIKTVRDVLGNSAQVVAVSTLDQAVIEVERQDFALIICGIHFDGLRTFDFLAILSRSSKLRRIPILVLRDVDDPRDRSKSRSLEVAATALGAVKFVDMLSMKQQHGAAAANLALRGIIDRYL